ncbi:tail fiber protein [Escherichia coli]|nr:hypothetical protein [Shigella flexneri]EGS7092910.1 hypothetical protein [Escherichia coli]EFP4693465.1 hypothetical protein [Shigella flexneri]EFS3910077.1 hypothetical protein [Shigella flexneri]EFS3914164.1 hypothetical protein [Shigella flexneri]
MEGIVKLTSSVSGSSETLA